MMYMVMVIVAYEQQLNGNELIIASQHMHTV
jgi:hypothetical protein